MTTAAPKIELKNIKVASFASEETHCYEATLYVDGEKWGVVSNEGHGGPDNFYGVGGKGYADIKALDERIAATYPEVDCTDIGAPGMVLKQSLEMLCGGIVNDHLTTKDLLRALRSKMLFTKPGAEGVFEVPLKQKGRVWSVEQVKAAIEKRTPGIVVLNTLPLDQALAVYRAGAR